MLLRREMAVRPDGVRRPGPTQSSEHEAATAPRAVPVLVAAFPIVIINSMPNPSSSRRRDHTSHHTDELASAAIHGHVGVCNFVAHCGSFGIAAVSESGA